MSPVAGSMSDAMLRRGFVNDGPTDHTTTAYGGGQKIWDSKILSAGASYSYTFAEVGSFDYVCALHPDMQAHVEVVP